MIIKGTEHSSARNLARYLLRAKANETCRLWELRDSASDTLGKSLSDWEMIGRCKTKGSKILYHAHIRVCDDERMDTEQWRETIQNLEARLGFSNCPRAIVGHEHAQKGLHVHLVWSRYDPERKTLVTLGNDHQKHHRVAREAELQYGLRPAVEPANEYTRKRRRATDREIRAIKERGSDREQLSRLLEVAWAASRNGDEMRKMLKTLKIELTPGDRRDWIVQYKGLKLNPVRLLPDVKTAAFRARMQDVDLSLEKAQQYEVGAMKNTFRRKAARLLEGEMERAVKSKPPTPEGTRDTRKDRPRPKRLRRQHDDDRDM